MKKNTWDKLKEIFKGSPLMRGESVEDEEIKNMTDSIGFTLPSDYIEFVKLYGGAIVGPFSIFGLRAAGAMGDDEASAIDVTKCFRNDGWPGTENWLVISMDHSGNPVGLDQGGKIWISDHDAGEVGLLADSFEAYLRNFCLKCD